MANTTNRLQKIRQKLTEKELDGIFISQPENRHYLSGFHGTAGYLFITDKQAVLATDFRYIEQAKIQAPDYRIHQITGKVAEWFPPLIAELGIKRLGFESSNVTFAFYRQLSDVLNQSNSSAKLIPTEGMAESLRIVKEPDEIELIARATQITDRAYAYLKTFVRVGMTEKEIAWKLESYMREQGSQSLPFDIIVASGPNSALPHAQPSERKVNAGEPVVIDMGARIGWYASDMTRTICLGEPDDTFKKVYDTVLGAQLAAIAMIKEGMTGDLADKLARTVIEEAGYGDKFGHSLGHGVGLAEHEEPRLGPNSTDVLQSGMVFSIEPGIYLPGWGGVRIEDLATLENGQLKIISKTVK